MPEITVAVRNVYGKNTIYPVCDLAKKFAEIAGTTTLTPFVLCKIAELGFEVKLDDDQQRKNLLEIMGFKVVPL